jgi:hypothetical protein
MWNQNEADSRTSNLNLLHQNSLKPGLRDETCGPTQKWTRTIRLLHIHFMLSSECVFHERVQTLSDVSWSDEENKITDHNDG